MIALLNAIAARLRAAWAELITWFNGIFTLLALYALSNPQVSAMLLPFVPEKWRSIAGVVLPIAMFWLAQKGKEIDKARDVGPAPPVLKR